MEQLVELVELHLLMPVALSSLSAGHLTSLISKLLGQSRAHVHEHRASPDLVAHIDSLVQKKDLGPPKARLVSQSREHPSLMRDRVHKFHQLEATAEPARSKLLAEGQGGS